MTLRVGQAARSKQCTISAGPAWSGQHGPGQWRRADASRAARRRPALAAPPPDC